MEARTRKGSASIVRSSASRPSGLRVALVHDWLTGMRGGEKCLEVLCEAFPDATLHTLIHRKGSLSPAIEAMVIRTSPLQRVPGALPHYRRLLPLMPLAARAWRPGEVDLVVSLSHCVAKAVRPPEGVPHVCYCFTPMRYAWEGRHAYLDTWSKRPVRRGLAGRLLDGLRAWDRATSARVSHFVAISETVRERIARCYGRESRVIEPPVDADVLHAGRRASRRAISLRLGAGGVQAGRARGAGLLAIGKPAGRHRRGSRAGANPGDGRAERPVPGMAARRGDPRPLSPLPCPALPRRGGLRDRAGRSPGVRGTRHRAGTRGRGRDGRRRGRPHVRHADARWPAPGDRRLGNGGQAPRCRCGPESSGRPGGAGLPSAASRLPGRGRRRQSGRCLLPPPTWGSPRDPGIAAGSQGHEQASGSRRGVSCPRRAFTPSRLR